MSIIMFDSTQVKAPLTFGKPRTQVKVKPVPPPMQDESGPSDADRAWWAANSPANRVNFFVVGEKGKFDRPKVRPVPTRAANQDALDCQAMLDEIRPPGDWKPTPEWDEYAFQAERIERSFGIRR